MARTYKRDNRGRFASTGSARGAKPATRMATRGANRLTRDNAGRITSVGGDGATARGGRLRTASGKARGKVLARIGGGGGKLRGGKGKAEWSPTTNAKGQVTGFRNRNAPMPSREAVAKAGRQGRATRNLNAAMKREGDGPNSKASRSASVAKRASAIYSGKVDPKVKTKARLTRTQDPEALRRRVKKMKDNTTVKPARARARKAKTADDLLTQATRIEIRGRRMSRAARTGARDRQIESRAVRAARAARAKAFEMQKPKPESKTAKMKRERAARVKAREQATNASRLIQAARRRRS